MTTNWQKIIEVPQYEVPELVFGGSTTIEPGVISPLALCNFTANTVSIDVQINRYDATFDTHESFWLVRNLPLPAYDTKLIPLNGQFFKTGDELEVKADTTLAVHATLSFTLGQSEEDDV